MNLTNPKYILFLCMISEIAMTEVLKEIKRSRKPLSKGFPPVWNGYIHKIMEIALSRIFLNDHIDCMTEVLSTKVISSNTFLLYSREILQNSLHVSRVSKASTRLTLQTNESIMDRYVSGHHPFINYTWVFKTHLSLALNITVENIQFANDYLGCFWGRLIIYNFKSLGSPFTYCGHHTKFNIYPSYSNVNITIHSYRYSIFIFSASHTIIIKNQIVSISTSNFEISWIYFVERNNFMYTFHIKVRKIYHVVVLFSKMESYRYNLFDGSGLMSTNFRNSHHKYKMSTFQCIAQILTKKNQMRRDGYFDYTSKGINISHVFKISSNDSSFTITHSMNTCFHQHCAVYLFTAEKFQIDITLLKIIYKGATGERCKYGGFLTGEKMMNDYKESLTICEPHGGAEYNSLRFFSKNSSLILLTYWYEHYSEISTTVNVSLTKCSAVQLDSCTFQKLCNPIYSNNSAKCNLYMKDISNSHLKYLGPKHLSYQKDFNHQDIHDLHDFVFFSLDDDECIVIQFRKRIVSLGEMAEPHCKIQLRSTDASQQGKELQYVFKRNILFFFPSF